MTETPHPRRLTLRRMTGGIYESLDVRVRLILFFVDLLGSFFFFPLHLLWRRGRRYDPKEIRKILIFRLDGLGDLVLSTAALREIRKGFPGAEITLVIGPWSQGIAPCIPFFDHLVVHDAFAFGYFRGRRTLSIRKEFDFIWGIRREHFDLGIDLRGDILSIIPLFLSGARFRFGRVRWGGGFFLTHPVFTDRSKDVHEKEKTLALLRLLEIPITDSGLELHIPEEDVALVERFLCESKIVSEDRIVTMAPAALYHWREWPPHKYAELAKRLAEEYPCKIVLIGGLEDKEVLEEIRTRSDGSIVSGAGRLKLCGTAALIRRSALFIGNESGLSHIAAAVKTPLIQLFGPGEPEKFGHTGHNQVFIMKTDCPDHPCRQRQCSYPQRWCMDLISVDDVLDACRTLLGGVTGVTAARMRVPRLLP